MPSKLELGVLVPVRENNDEGVLVPVLSAISSTSFLTGSCKFRSHSFSSSEMLPGAKQLLNRAAKDFIYGMDPHSRDQVHTSADGQCVPLYLVEL